MHYSAKRGLRSHVVCPVSVRPSVCLWRWWIVMTGWNSSKITSRLVSLGCSLSADPNMTGLLQKFSKFSPELGWGAEKSEFWRTKALISLKRGKIGQRLLSLLWGRIGSPKHAFDRANIIQRPWMTLKGYYALRLHSRRSDRLLYCDVMLFIIRCFKEFGKINVLKYILIMLAV